MKKTILLSASVLALGFTGQAAAQQYVSGSAGFALQSDSNNSGALTRDFVTGDGVAIPAGTALASGTDVAWNTEFETGYFLSGAYGIRLNEYFRVEGEIAYSSNDVDTHTGVTVGGGDIGAADAAVLITGSAPLGATVADVVADGQGDIKTLSFAVNGYYDVLLSEAGFDGKPVMGYIGAGLGVAEVEVEYSPSNVGIVSDTESALLYQFMAGVSMPLDDATEIFGGYRYRATEDVDVDSSLFPATLDVENQSNIFEVGIRYSF